MGNKCPDCGNKMRVIINDSTKVFECEYCGYSYVTTIAEGIKWDPIDYTIIIDKNINMLID